jgi:hypothetical protein
LIFFLANLSKVNMSFCHHLMSVVSHPFFGSFGQAVSEEKIFKKIGQSETRIAGGGHVW